MAVAPVKGQEPISQAAAPPAVTSPDQSMAVAPVKAQEPIAVPTNAHANPMSDDARGLTGVLTRPIAPGCR